MNRKERRALQYKPFSDSRIYYQMQCKIDIESIEYSISVELLNAWSEFCAKATDEEFNATDILWNSDIF